jgi:polyisoprenoid-binding protein YceI
MTRSKTLIALFALFASTAFAEQFKIDPAHSFAHFTVRHMMISNAAGRFSDLSGTINYDEKDLSKCSVDAHIKAATINTDNETRDKDLRSPNFFEVEKYPELTFKSDKIEKRGDQFVAIGSLTMHGVAKQIELPFELTKADTPRGTAIGVIASTKLNRKDFGINGGGGMVGDDVKIELSIEAKAAPAAAPATKKQ